MRAILEIEDGVTSSALPVPTTRAATPAPAVATEPARLADWQRRTRDARAAVLAEVDRLQLLGGTSTTRAVALVAQGARIGQLSSALLSLVPVANARSRKGEGNRTLSVETVLRWYRARAAHGIAGLVPKESKPAAPVPVWLAPLLKLWRQPQHPSLLACLEELPKHLPPDITAPTETTARRWMNKMSIQERSKGRLGQRAMLALKAFIRRDTSMLEPMDIVVSDGHTFRARCAHPIHGKPFQPEVMAVMDAATRYVCGWSAGLSESTHVVMDGLRHGVSNLGLFAIMYTDRGSGFVNEVTGDELTGFYARLHCIHEKAQAGRAQARGLIERPNQSLWRRSAKKQVSYVARDMDREAARRIDKLTTDDIKRAGRSDLLPSWQELLTFLRAEVDAYNNRPHSKLPKIRDPQTLEMRHMSPAECLQSWRDKGWQPMMLDAAEMDDLFRPYERRATRRGEVQLPWGRYYHQQLVQHHGDTVLVGYDIHDGDRVWVRSVEGRLLCVAQRDGNVQPYMPATKVEHARNVRAKGRARIAHDRLREIELERAGAGPLIDVAPVQLTPDQIEAADAMYAALEPPVPAAQPVAADVRPNFADDTSWARWLAAHPDGATDDDRKYLAEQLRRNPFRMLMAAEDVSLDALAAIVRKPKAENSHA
ncbi:Mu transposase C-terminal domain-containing protein [Azospirillum agricola]|uniref:Mu transposase C-terminal domain-containing protein n=1 Tax=Azospirillum agricola TaxID=1720247 RepID=UPI0015C489B7|nr:Mu transposase C-terminal domain-containing protein [Azospirillum agricola]